MKAYRIAAIASLAFIACADDYDDTQIKGTVDVAALSAGATVLLQAGVGVVDVPFDPSNPIPEVPRADLEDELSGAVSLVVTNPETGVTADLATGELVTSTPSGPGEYTWAVSDDRTTARLTFFNETTRGFAMQSGDNLAAQLSIATNDYIQRVSPMTFDVAVQ